MSADSPVDPAATTPAGSGDAPDTIKISSPVSRSAIKISIPTAGADGTTDLLVISIPMAAAPGDVDVTRISGASGQTIDTIKISDSNTGGGG